MNRYAQQSPRTFITIWPLLGSMTAFRPPSTNTSTIDSCTAASLRCALALLLPPLGPLPFLLLSTLPLLPLLLPALALGAGAALNRAHRLWATAGLGCLLALTACCMAEARSQSSARKLHNIQTNCICTAPSGDQELHGADLCMPFDLGLSPEDPSIHRLTFSAVPRAL